MKEFRLYLAEQSPSCSRLHAEFFHARLRIKNLVTPLFSGRAKMKNREAFSSLKAKFTVDNVCRFDRGKRNPQPDVTAKKYLARFQQRLPFGPLFAKLNRATRFATPRVTTCITVQTVVDLDLPQSATTLGDTHNSKL